MGSDSVSGTIEGEGNDILPMRRDEDDDPGYASYILSTFQKIPTTMTKAWLCKSLQQMAL
jgi:hypothetical protein